MEISKNKITEIFGIIDDSCQEYDKEIAGQLGISL